MPNLKSFILDLRSYPLNEQLSMGKKLDDVTHLCVHATGYPQGFYQVFLFPDQELDVAEFIGISPNLVSPFVQNT